MKKRHNNFWISLALMVMFSAISWAQPTFDATNLPSIGAVYVWDAADTAGVTAGSAGANVTWDFSTLTIQTVDETTEWLDPKNTPFGSSFPNATHCEKADTAYSYFVLSNGRWTRLGEASEALQSGPWADPLDVALVPWTYQSVLNDVARHSFSSQGIPVRRGGTISAVYDGYGTLKLPQGSFANAMRIKYLQVISDTITVSAGPFTIISIAHTTVNAHSWFEPGNPTVLLTISDLESKVTVGGPSPSEQIVYAKHVLVTSKSGGSGTDAPTLLDPKDMADVKVRPIVLSWSEVKDAKGYVVEVAVDKDFNEVVIDSTTADLTMSLSNLSPLTTYYWRVAVSAGGIVKKSSDQVQGAVWSDYRAFRVFPVDPTLTLPGQGDSVMPGSIAFVWESELSTNRIQVSYNADFSMELFNEVVPGNSYSLNIATLGQYYWRARAEVGTEFVGDWSTTGIFSVRGTVGVDEETFQAITVSPQPASNEVTIRGVVGELTYSICNGFGEQLMTGVGSNEFSIDVRTLPAGTYFLKISVDSKSSRAQRISIMR